MYLVLRGGVLSPRGVYLVTEGGVCSEGVSGPSGGGGVWSGGVYLVRGVSAPGGVYPSMH